MFEFFDYEFVNSRDLYHFASELKIDWDLESAAAIIDRYDRDQDGRLSFYEFCELIAPVKQDYAILLSERASIDLEKVRVKRMKAYSQDTRHKIIDLFDIHFQVESEIRQLKEELKNNQTFDPIESFRLFDAVKQSEIDQVMTTGKVRTDGKVTRHKLRKTFQNYGYQLTTNEIGLLMSRFDLSNSGKISYADFLSQC